MATISTNMKPRRAIRFNLFILDEVQDMTPLYFQLVKKAFQDNEPQPILKEVGMELSFGSDESGSDESESDEPELNESESDEPKPNESKSDNMWETGELLYEYAERCQRK